MDPREPKKPLLGWAAATRFIRDFSFDNVLNALTAFIFAASGPVAIILAVGEQGGLTDRQIASWIFSVFFFNGVISIIYCFAYRQPLVFLWSIPGAVLVGTALENSSFAEVIGAFLITGVLLLALGFSGAARRTLEWLPMPIVMAMVAGIFLSFVLDWVYAFQENLVIAGGMTAAFICASVLPALFRKAPPILAALVAGLVLMLISGDFHGDAPFVFSAPLFQTPKFSAATLVELVIPLAITVLIVQNGQGVAVLKTAGHQPPINSIANACGSGSIITACFGGVSTCLTGPVNAIIASSANRKTQYAAGIIVGALGVIFGIGAPLFTQIMLATPNAFIATLAGLAILRVLQNAFTIAFTGDYTLGALVTFVVTISGVSIFHIGAPFWGLIFGYFASRIFESQSSAAAKQ